MLHNTIIYSRRGVFSFFSFFFFLRISVSQVKPTADGIGIGLANGEQVLFHNCDSFARCPAFSLASLGSSLDFPQCPEEFASNFCFPTWVPWKEQIFTLFGSGSAGLSPSESWGGKGGGRVGAGIDL